jgi:uncharacterized protein with von Willebrand factor type A (vWA) domain
VKIYVAAVKALINKWNETLQMINKSKHPKKGEEKREGLMSKKTKEPPKGPNHQGTSSSQTPSSHNKHIK